MAVETTCICACCCFVASCWHVFVHFSCAASCCVGSFLSTRMFFAETSRWHEDFSFARCAQASALRIFSMNQVPAVIFVYSATERMTPGNNGKLYNKTHLVTQSVQFVTKLVWTGKSCKTSVCAAKRVRQRQTGFNRQSSTTRKQPHFNKFRLTAARKQSI